MSFEAYSEEKLKIINNYIRERLNGSREKVSQRFSHLIEAMSYSIEGPGKRLRPLFVLASAEYVGLEDKQVLPVACAVEYIHTYSLIHDDLPAIDDDDERRGKPSSHKRFGEAVAILAGDALLTEAFAQLCPLVEECDFPPENVLRCVQLLSNFAGVGGMVGGQFLDVSGETTEPTLPELEFIHIHKTGALIKAAVMLPAWLSGADEQAKQELRTYAEAVGLAFQISDDILDSHPKSRYSRRPRSKPKPSYPLIMGASEARQRLNGLIDHGIEALSRKNKAAAHLVEIAEFVKSRKN